MEFVFFNCSFCFRRFFLISLMSREIVSLLLVIDVESEFNNGASESFSEMNVDVIVNSGTFRELVFFIVDVG